MRFSPILWGSKAAKIPRVLQYPPPSLQCRRDIALCQFMHYIRCVLISSSAFLYIAMSIHVIAKPTLPLKYVLIQQSRGRNIISRNLSQTQSRVNFTWHRILTYNLRQVYSITHCSPTKKLFWVLLDNGSFVLLCTFSLQWLALLHCCADLSTAAQ